LEVETQSQITYNILPTSQCRGEVKANELAMFEAQTECVKNTLEISKKYNMKGWLKSHLFTTGQYFQLNTRCHSFLSLYGCYFKLYIKKI